MEADGAARKSISAAERRMALLRLLAYVGAFLGICAYAVAVA